MSAKATVVQIIEHRKDWEELWWIMAENEILKFNEIKRLEVVQFYRFLDHWKEVMRKKTEANRQQNQNQKRRQ